MEKNTINNKENLNTNNDEVKINKNMSEKDFKRLFCQLFKFDKSFFKSFIFFIHIVVQVFSLVSVLFITAKEGVFPFLLGIILYPFVFLGIRFMFEFLVIMFSINDNLYEIKKELRK